MKSQHNNNFINYQPVSCEMHSELELAIMHGKFLIIQYLNPAENKTIKETIKPCDIVSRSNKDHSKAQLEGEFLLCTDSKGKTFEIRLDCIQSYAHQG